MLLGVPPSNYYKLSFIMQANTSSDPAPVSMKVTKIGDVKRPRRRSPRSTGPGPLVRSVGFTFDKNTEREHKKGTHVGANIVSRTSTKRWDVQEAYENLFLVSSDEDGEVEGDTRGGVPTGGRSPMHWKSRVRQRRSASKESAEITYIRRKLRAASHRLGIHDWERLFAHYDRDGSGGLDFQEFSMAVTGDVGVAAEMLGSTQMRQCFDAIDTDSNGFIECGEFTKWLSNVEAASAAHSGAHTSLLAANAKPPMAPGVPFVAEFLVQRRCEISERPAMHSKTIGFVEKGEIVAVVRCAGNRMRIQRLRLKAEPHAGWVSEKALEVGPTCVNLEQLPRDEWSTGIGAKHERAVAERVALIQSTKELAARPRGEPATPRRDAFPRGLAVGGGGGGDQAAAVALLAVSRCTSVAEAASVVSMLETTPRGEWKATLARSSYQKPPAVLQRVPSTEGTRTPKPPPGRNPHSAPLVRAVIRHHSCSPRPDTLLCAGEAFMLHHVHVASGPT